jgi:uncharacterized membrane protein
MSDPAIVPTNSHVKDLDADRLIFSVKLLVTAIALVIGIASLRYLSGSASVAPADLQLSFLKNGRTFIAHTTFSSLALITGGFQFFGSIRRKSPRLHRVLGRSYVLFCIAGALTAILIAPDVKSGGIAATGFTLLAVAWAVSTTIAWREAVLRRFSSHRIWMLRSYALTAAAISLRLQIAIFGVLGFQYSEVSNFLSFSCWIPNIVVLELWLRASAQNIVTVAE